MKSMHFTFPHVRIKLQRDPKDRSVSGNTTFYMAHTPLSDSIHMTQFVTVQGVMFRVLTWSLSTGNGLGIRVVGGKEVPGSNGEIGAYVAKVLPGGAAEQTGKIVEGKETQESQ